MRLRVLLLAGARWRPQRGAPAVSARFRFMSARPVTRVRRLLAAALLAPAALAAQVVQREQRGDRRVQHPLRHLFAVGGEYLIIESPSLVNVFGGVLAWVMFFAVSVLELLVMFLQAYVFTLLTAMYIGSAIADEH